ncbi:MAG: aminotransferase class I/II-fold pyridoxal phosphate-dependent enzyme [Candidatus Omnitrophica bacterium]|nr:aminotransferase class I/II-fold pyridoxal phosphate-dependent enzyme [Candidatus Omnitrophota bacterium]
MRVIARRNIAHYRGELKDILILIFQRRIKEGPYIKQFEEQFSKYIGTKYAIAVASGRLGLFLILDALSLNKNDEVMLPAYTDESVSEVIQSLGLAPIFIDIERDTHNIDANFIEGKINSRTKAILATHIFGRPCNLAKITEIAKKHSLVVIEDCAHAIGAEYNGRRVGSFGAAAYFSFGITKPFNTFGGGMITTNDPVLYAKIEERSAHFDYPVPAAILKKALISYGLFLLTSPPFFLMIVFPWLLFLSFFDKDLINIYNKTVKPVAKSGASGVKYTNMQALMGIRQLSNIDTENESRRRNAGLLMSLIEGKIDTLKDREALRPTYYFFVVLTRDASGLAKKLLRKGIDTGKHIMRDCSAIDGKESDCVSASEAVRVSLQIPNYPRLKEADMRYIAGILTRECTSTRCKQAH